MAYATDNHNYPDRSWGDMTRTTTRLLIATDAYAPQINGVVRTYEYLNRELIELGVQVSFLTPDGFRTVGWPGYREIRLALPTFRAISRTINPDHASDARASRLI